MMDSRERVVTALNHKEPDRVPFDLSATYVTGISKVALEKWLDYRKLPHGPVEIFDLVQQLGKLEEAHLKNLRVDARGLVPRPGSDWTLKFKEENGYRSFVDQWGIKWRTPIDGGLYYDMAAHPLATIESAQELEKFQWPDATDPARREGLLSIAEEHAKEAKSAIVLCSVAPGFYEVAGWMRGLENFYADLASNPDLACSIMDKVLDIKMAFWDAVLPELGPRVDVLVEFEDIAGQYGQIISLEMYKKFIKPRQKRLFSLVKRLAPRAKIFLHSCGSVYDLLPHFIEVGVDIINPVQVSAAKMDTRKLKKDFGNDVVFWGGGVDTQHVLPKSTPQQVRDEVRRRIDDLAPGGGFVFNTVHNIQPDVPPENLEAMWETLMEYGVY